MRIAQSVIALRDTDLAEILASRAERAHVIGGQEGEACVRPTRSVRKHRIARKYAEAAEALAKRVDVVRICTDAGNHFRVTGLNCAQRTAQRDNSTGTP